jgi:hypothetical protein
MGMDKLIVKYVLIFIEFHLNVTVKKDIMMLKVKKNVIHVQRNVKYAKVQLITVKNVKLEERNNYQIVHAHQDKLKLMANARFALTNVPRVKVQLITVHNVRLVESINHTVSAQMDTMMMV